MMKTKAKTFRKRKQRKLNRKFTRSILVSLYIVMIIITIVSFTEVSGKNQSEGESQTTIHESKKDDHSIVTSPANASLEKETHTKTVETSETIEEEVFCRNLSDDDKLMLAKIAMAEAEGESLNTKILVILTVLNRVEADYFPDTIEEVIFQCTGGIYEFSPVMPNGRWWTTEPNDECWEAVEIVNTSEDDISSGALFFEACYGESWHSRNLEFICQSDNTRFYK